jgi:photosystem II stability/assembly factor-like uncharacterized protein
VTHTRGFVLSICLCTLTSLAPAQQFSPDLYAALRWRMIGPFRGGRTVGISGIPAQPNVFYMAANNGGVWKSTDYGHVWKPIFDDQPTGSIGALAIAPSNPDVIYVGSGEGLQRPDLSVGDGIYKSTDGGQSWQHLGLRNGLQISAILIDPRDANHVYVAVLGHPYGPNEERGVFQSTDGGQSWQKALYKDENTGAVDLAFDPSNPRIIYASMWAARRPPWSTGNGFNGPGSGLFKTTDAGAHWQQLTDGLPTVAEGLGRIGIGIAPSDPKRIYAMVDAKSGGVYRSDDAGQHWQRVNGEQRVWGRGSDFANVRVDPKNQDTIYVANTSTYRSTDGGHTFTAIKGAPGGDDYHTIWINPDNPQIILLGSDQGATITVNGGETWSSWYNQPTAQFYHVITDNRFPYWVYGGQQESGSAGTASRSDYGEITFRDWHTIGVEEYGYVAPDPLDPDIIYGGKVSRYNQTTGQVQQVGPVVLRTGKYRFNRTQPIIFSHVDPHVLYFGSQVLFKTINGGRSWDIISPDLTRENPGDPPNLGIFTQSDPARGKHRGVIYSIGPSFKDVNQIWIGTDDGLIQMTRDGGKSWRNVTPPEMTPWSKVAQIEGSHFETQTAYAAVNRLRLDDLHPYIYRTHDGGKTWQNIVNGLPDDPVNTVREDPVRKGLLFAGTERTVYVSFNDGDRWQPLRLNLPATSIRDLVVHEDDVVVGTHGRSFWILDDITPLRQINADVVKADAYLFRPEVAYRVRRSVNTDTPLPPEEPAGQNPPDGAIVNYYLKSAPSGPVTLDILGAAGKLVRRYSSTDQPEPIDRALNVPTYWVRPPNILSAAAGSHRFVWDLHGDPPDALRHEYPISAIYRDTPQYPLGPAVMPGRYTVKLTVDGKSYTQLLTVKMDPRVKATATALEQQFQLATQLCASMHQDYEALQKVRALRAQLKGLQQPGALAAAISALDKKAGELEGVAAAFGGGREAGGGESLAQLSGELSTLLGVIEGADAAPTTQAVAEVGAVQRALQTQLTRWREIQTRDVPALNTQLQQANLPAIQLD